MIAEYARTVLENTALNESINTLIHGCNQTADELNFRT